MFETCRIRLVRLFLTIRLPIFALIGSILIFSPAFADEPVNYVLGTQTFGIKYKFTEKTGLVETAERIHEMGSYLLKFSMTKRDTAKERYNHPENENIRSLTDLAKLEPSVRTVLEMPFNYYQIWVYAFSHEEMVWANGFSKDEQATEYKEIYEFTKHLLTTYNGTDKIFYLGHWEGDWHLTYRREDELPPTKIQGMIDWLNTRQKAIDDAKRDTEHERVDVFHYTEVNLVQKGMKGGKCLVNDVLPKTSVDYVSYSCYDTIYPNMGNVVTALHEALDYIESKLPPKSGIEGKRVFLGEYGYALERTKTAQKQDKYARDVCIAALEWGCPFILYWEMYCNENPDGKHRGFWLINDKNEKQPFYFTMERYYSTMSKINEEFREKNGRAMNTAEIRERALLILNKSE